jgi:peptide/nickel transport system permease protein
MADAAALERANLEEGKGKSTVARWVGFFVTLARRKPLGFIGLVFIVIMVIVAIFPGLFAIHEPGQTGVGPRLRNYCVGPTDTILCPTVRETSIVTGRVTLPGSTATPLGTDQLGRDTYSRLVYGARWAVYIGLVAVTLSSLIALLVGVSSGYFGGTYDAIIQRFVDAVMALPALVLLIALPVMIGRWDLDGPLPFDEPRVTFFKLALILGILGGASGSRVIRAAVIGVRSSQYLEAAKVIGATDSRIMLRHVVPNIFGPLMVQATIGLGAIILVEAAVSYLGFGVQDPNSPTWGQMLNLGQQVASTKPMQVVFPSIFIALAVFSFNMLGDALRDLLDPRLRGARGSFQ